MVLLELNMAAYSGVELSYILWVASEDGFFSEKVFLKRIQTPMIMSTIGTNSLLKSSPLIIFREQSINDEPTNIPKRFEN